MRTQSENWKRLTRKQVVDYVIVSLIIQGADPEGELIPDGDPGSFLEKIIRENMIDWVAARGGRQDIPGDRILFLYIIQQIAETVGYARSEPLQGFVEYLRHLPAEGPIGQQASS